MAFFEAIKNSAQAILQSKTVSAGTSATTVTPDSGYDGLSDVTVNPTPSQEKTATSSRNAQIITPDSDKLLSKVTINALVPSGTFTANTKNSALDMGATNNYRYVDTSGIANTNSDTYTFASGDTGGTKDLGETNTYRYVNAANVYAKGKADGATGVLLPNNGQYIMGNDNTYATGTYSGSAIGPISSGSIRGFCIINVKNYNTATCSGSWALTAAGIKNGIVTPISAPASGNSVSVRDYDYFMWMTNNRQFTFS